MKKIVVFIILLLMRESLFAQIGYGPEIGLGIASMRFAPPLAFNTADASPVFSFRAGGIVDIPIDKKVYFQTGLFFSRKGAQRSYAFYNSDSNNVAINQTLLVNYIEMPLTVMIKSDIQGKIRVFAGLGVTMSNIVGGRNMISIIGDTAAGKPFHNSYNSTISTTTTLNGFDVGMNVQAGIELPSGLYFKLNYLLGVSDVGKGTEIDKNRVFCIASGWYFGKFRNANRDDDNLIDSQVE